MKDAEANDMIHMGSDQRCVMATFLINMLEKKTRVRWENKKTWDNCVCWTQKAKNANIEVSELEERYQEIVDTNKKPPPEKEVKYMTQEITRKIKSKERTPQQKQKAHLLKL